MKPPQRIGPEVLDQSLSLAMGEHFSARDFYDRVEDRVSAHKLPALESSRVDLSEGGALSDRREYLRFRRERLYFDVCAAPAGVNFFFSYRFYLLPAPVQWWQVVIVAGAMGFLFEMSQRHVGFFLGPVILIAACALGAWTARNAIGLGLRDLDATLLKTPVVGPIYERFLRKDTYYRQDLRTVYGSIVSDVVKGEIERATAAKGAVLVREFSYSPLFDGLYKARERTPPDEARGTPPEADP